MKAWSLGLKNTVAISGHVISKIQAKKLSHLGVNIILCYDKDVGNLEDGNVDYDFYKKEKDKFLINIFQNACFQIIKKNSVSNKKRFSRIFFMELLFGMARI